MDWTFKHYACPEAPDNEIVLAHCLFLGSIDLELAPPLLEDAVIALI